MTATAALFGAALPYIQCLCATSLPVTFRQIPPEDPFAGCGLYLQSEPYRMFAARTLFDDHTSISINTYDRKPIPEVDALYSGLMPDKGWEHLFAGQRVELQRVGWPFRAIYSISSRGGVGSTDWSDYGLALPTNTLPWLPGLLPTRIIWSGLFGNIALSVLSFSAIYAAAHSLKTRRRLNRDLCRKCNYSRVGLGPNTKCPECGTI